MHQQEDEVNEDQEGPQSPFPLFFNAFPSCNLENQEEKTTDGAAYDARGVFSTHKISFPGLQPWIVEMKIRILSFSAPPPPNPFRRPWRRQRLGCLRSQKRFL